MVACSAPLFNLRIRFSIFLNQEFRRAIRRALPQPCAERSSAAGDRINMSDLADADFVRRQ
jgi:hypothetical protein